MVARPFIYPSSDLDRSRALLSVLGSFWSRTYTASDQVRSYADGTAMLAAQSYRNLLEVVACLSRFDIPLYHTEMWTPLVLRKSQRNSAQTNVARFDRVAATFESGLVFDSAATQQFYAFPKPTNMVSAGQILNRLIYPTLALAENVDYVFDDERGAIVFTNDPFDSPHALKRGIYNNADLIDEEIVLWAFQAQYDYDYLFNQFAYALGLRLKTSQGYKDLMNAIFSGLVNGGATAADLDLAFSAICGVPVAMESGEVVEAAVRDAAGTIIATDRYIYRFSEDATPVVAVGDTLRAGARLTDALEIRELTDGELPNTLAALVFDSGYLAACFHGDLIFENKDVPLEVNSAHASGYTYVKFGLGGFPADVEQFFDELHARGIAAAEQLPDPCVRREKKQGTLAHLLDSRAQPDGEPTANYLPATINPLKFIVANILRNNVFLVRIKAAALGQNRLGLYNIRHLRQLIPPHAAMIVIYEIGGISDSLAGAENLVEGVTTFTGMAPQNDAVPVEYMQDAGATLRTLSGTCQ
jgi:hypothetical protein